MPKSPITRQFVAKNQSVILRAVADVTQARCGEAMGHDAGYVSRFFKGEQKISADEVLALLDAAGLAVHRISETDLIVTRDDWARMVWMAKRYMEELEP